MEGGTVGGTLGAIRVEGAFGLFVSLQGASQQGTITASTNVLIVVWPGPAVPAVREGAMLGAAFLAIVGANVVLMWETRGWWPGVGLAVGDFVGLDVGGLVGAR